MDGDNLRESLVVEGETNVDYIDCIEQEKYSKSNLSHHHSDKNESKVILEQTDYFDDHLVEKRLSRVWFQRYFSPIKEGSLRGSTISLASICFDTTALSFPLALHNGGLIPGTLIFLLIIISSYFTLRVLLISGRKMRTLDYRELIGKCYGDSMVYFCDLNISLFCIGAQAAYIVTINHMFMESLAYFVEFDVDNKMLKLIQMLGCMIFLQIPLSMLRDMSKLQYASMAGSVVLIFTMFVMVIESFDYFRQAQKEGREVELFKVNWELLDTFSLFLFGYATHNGMFIIYSEMKNPTLRRKKKVLNRAMFLQSMIFALIAYSGFFSLPSEMPSIFLSRLPLKTFDPNDYLVITAKILFVISLHCLCAINFNQLRATLKAHFFNNQPITNTQNLYTTSTIYLFSNIVAFFAANVVNIIGVISGLCVTNICYVFPILCYIKTNGDPISSVKNTTCLAFLIVISSVGIMATIKAGIDNFNS